MQHMKPLPGMLEIAVFGSGQGSNFQAILNAVDAGRIPGARIRVVLSNNSAAGILDIARAHGLPALHVSQKQFATEAGFADNVLALLRKHDVNFIVLAGYMKRLPARIIEAYRNRIVNIHPALLPAFSGKGMYGMRVHEAVIAAGEGVSGATVHLVDEEYDHGAIVLHKTVAVAPGETPETLAAKVLKVEHELYPEAVRLFAEGKVIINQREVAVRHS